MMKQLIKYIVFLLVSIMPLSAEAYSSSIFAELLVWNASEQTSTSWANVITSPTSNTTDFSPKNVDFNWHHGFRGGFLYEPTCDWETKLYWTYFAADKNIHYAPAAQIIIPEFFSGFLSGDIFFGANLNWQLVMNTIDFEVRHKFHIGKSLILRPSIGIKAGTINQAINAKWNAVILTSTEKLENNFFGVGPSFGIEGEWNIYNAFSFIGNFSAAFMWGNWKIHDTYKRPAVSLGPIPIILPTTIVTSLHPSMLGTLMLDYFLGLEWKYQGQHNITLQLGYEMQYWANQLRLPTFQQLPLHGDLTLQGGTCGIYINL